jgi:hypothetical protein
MALAIWAGATVEPVQINPWLLIGLFGAAFLAAIFRMIRRSSLATLRDSPILALWLATRFMLVPACVLLGLAWLICWATGLAAAPTLLNALRLTVVYGAVAILVTSVLADVAAAIKGPRPTSPSAS